MSRMTVRLPETLHNKLESLAQQEGVSLNQYIVYALTQQSTLTYTIQETPTRVLAEQRAAYLARLEDGPLATDEEFEQVMREREPIEPEPELTPELVARVRRKMSNRSR